MTSEFGPTETQADKFDASLIAPTQQDWEIITNSPYTEKPSERCYFIGDLAVLDPRRVISIPTLDDWNYFVQRNAELNEHPTWVIGRYPLITEMAKVDRERACKALNPGELDNWTLSLKSILRGEESVGLFPGSTQEYLIYTDPERTKKVFCEYWESAWNAEKRYASWLRRESPHDFFTLLAALTEISEEKTFSLLEKSDWRLAQEGLAYYREGAIENKYQVRPLITHLTALKKLTPLFERLSREGSSQ